ncbi:MAG: hypothetical protein ABII07_00180 [Patescibacteria group bacterium]|nr:hypothetical protein [Patescibacteria group bacterium]
MKPPLAAFLQTLGIATYCTLIGLFLWYGENYFPSTPSVITAILMLFLLVISAAITGMLVFGYPTYLALNKKIKESIKVLAYTLLFSVITILILAGTLVLR